jgi:GNAT superfamily N-acetyltransferase
MSYVVLTHVERPDLAERAADSGDEVWPEYNRHGDVVNQHWHRMRIEHPELQFVFYDEENDDLVAEGHTLAIPWDGSEDGLPVGFDGIFEPAFGAEPKTALCAMAAEIWPRHQGGGLARTLLEAMGDVGRRHGYADLLACVRPSWKERYPLAPIGEYAHWRRQDGQPFDPWVRVHVRMGAEIMRPEPESLKISGTVAEWEAWTQTAFPVSGEYVFPEGLATVAIDRDADVGLYYEPNVWLRHSLRG